MRLCLNSSTSRSLASGNASEEQEQEEEELDNTKKWMLPIYFHIMSQNASRTFSTYSSIKEHNRTQRLLQNNKHNATLLMLVPHSLFENVRVLKSVMWFYVYAINCLPVVEKAKV